MRKYSLEAVALIKDFFEKDDWKYKFDEESGIFTGGVDIGNKLGSVSFYLFVKDDCVLNATTMKLRVSEAERLAVAEYITRANYAMTLGCFEMDFNDGEVRFRMTRSLNDLRADLNASARLMMLLPCAMFKKYGDGLLEVMFGMKTPEEACKEAEKEADE